MLHKDFKPVRTVGLVVSVSVLVLTSHYDAFDTGLSVAGAMADHLGGNLSQNISIGVNMLWGD